MPFTDQEAVLLGKGFVRDCTNFPHTTFRRWPQGFQGKRVETLIYNHRTCTFYGSIDHRNEVGDVEYYVCLPVSTLDHLEKSILKDRLTAPDQD